MANNPLPLQCHFTWNPLDGIADSPLKPKINLDPQSRIDFLKTDIKMNPEIEVPGLTLIAYLHTHLQPPCLAEAMGFVERALAKSQTFHTSFPDMASGYEIVSLSIKAILLQRAGKSEKEIENVLIELHKLYPITNKAQAFIHGIHAYACSMLGPAKYKLGLQLSIQAAKLDPTWYAWRMSIASLAGRIRRFVEGPKSYPTAMEGENMAKAVSLSKERQPLPVVFLAEIFFTKGKFIGSELSDSNRLLAEAMKLYKLAYKLGPDSTYVLTRCGKAFAHIKDDKLAEECLTKSLKLQPTDSVTLRGLGKFYEFSDTKQDLKRALGYYTKAKECWQTSNVLSDLDLCRIRKKLDHNFNDLEQYRKLEQEYSEDKRSLLFIQRAAKKQEAYYQSRRQPHMHDRRQSNNRNFPKEEGQNNFKRDGVKSYGNRKGCPSNNRNFPKNEGQNNFRREGGRGNDNGIQPFNGPPRPYTRGPPGHNSREPRRLNEQPLVTRSSSSTRKHPPDSNNVHQKHSKETSVK